MLRVVVTVLALAVAAAGLSLVPFGPTAEAQDTPPNILLLIADDFGVESSVCYDDNPAPAPRLEAFCNEAVVFDDAWSSPICSPTRAGILTGRHGFRTGITEQASGANGLEIHDDEYTLPEVLDLAGSGYATANFGKWHLGGNASKPNDMGWDHFSGLLAGGFGDYEDWNKTTNGVTANEDTYATTANVDDALVWIGEQDTPWLTWIGFNAPHTPFHVPPSDLHTQTIDENSSSLEMYGAAVEALDTEIGRLIDSLDPAELDNTVIFFLGDNGTPAGVSDYGNAMAKGSVHNGGVHVPMMVWGAGVDGGRNSDALVGTVDIFSTVLELAGVDAASVLPADHRLDSVSFASVLEADGPVNEYVMAEISGLETADNREGATIRNDQYKVILFDNGGTRFYDLVADPNAQDSIGAGGRSAAEQAAYDELVGVLTAWTASPDAPRPSTEDPPPTPTPDPTPAPGSGVFGDVDCIDGLSIVDALVIAQYSVGNRTAGTCPLADPLTQIALDNADYNSDGSIDVVDALLISRCVVGLDGACLAGSEDPVDWVFDSSYTLDAVEGCEIVGTFLDHSQFDGAGADYPDPIVSVTCADGTFTSTGNGIPHTTFVQLTPRDLEVQDYEFTIPLSPIEAAVPTQIGADDGENPTLGTIGVAINGIPFFGPTEAAQPDPFGDPLANGIIDDCGGHHSPHHYHAMVASCFAPDWDLSQPSPIIGYAYDGYPVYGPTGCLDLSCDQVVEFQSSWVATGDLSTYAWDNVTFVADQGAEYLDACNGRVQPDGSYGYHATSTFPYIIGCFHGEVDLPARGGG